MHPEKLPKVAAGAQTAVVCNPGNGGVRFCQHPARPLKAAAGQVGHRSRVDAVLKQTEADPLADVGRLGDLFNPDRIGKVVMHVLQHDFQLIISGPVG